MPHFPTSPAPGPSLFGGKRWLLLATATLILGSSCKPPAQSESEARQPGEESPAALTAEAPAASSLPASHLGFAAHVPADADFFAAGFHANELINPLLELFVETKVITNPEEDESDAPPEEPQSITEMAAPYLGDEAFFFVGPGTGKQFEALARSYRDTSAATAGSLIGIMLDAANEEEPLDELEGNQDEILNNILGDLLDVVERDSRLQLPSLVMGWKPDPTKKQECLDALADALEYIAEANPSMKEGAFERSGVRMTGYQSNGRDIFGEELAEAREALAQEDSENEWTESISPERFEQLLSALENLEFTIATGSVDDYIMIYLGNGSEGFSLAENPAESLAASENLTWTNGFAGDPILAFSYVSEGMIRAGLPALDNAVYWEAVAKAVRAPIRDQRIFRNLLTEMAGIEDDLAQRDPSAWSAVLLKDQGWRLETRGGWPDPSLDYTAPLQMTDATIAGNPMIRAHWVQSRDRNNLEWKRTELFGVMFEAVLSELQAAGIGEDYMIPESGPQRFMEIVRDLNKTYRNEFRNGVGDEVAVLVDLHGMTPPIPGIPEDIVAELEMPRLIVARPVTDRSKLDAAGESFVAIWKDSISQTNELFELELPLLTPQSIDSKQLTTWYFPLPISGGDFIPGIYLNDHVWLMGTSRSMANEFSLALETTSTSEETGMIVEVDFEAFWSWAEDVYRLTKDEADELSEQAPDLVKSLDTEENRTQFLTTIQRLKAFRYRHWLDSGKPRTTRHLQISPAE